MKIAPVGSYLQNEYAFYNGNYDEFVLPKKCHMKKRKRADGDAKQVIPPRPNNRFFCARRFLHNIIQEVGIRRGNISTLASDVSLTCTVSSSTDI
jgi:hypothetical protein